MKVFSIRKRNKEMELLMESERTGLLQYACYRLGSSDDAEDAVQDLFVRLHQRLQDGGTDIRNLTAYLYRSLSNLCVSRLRQAEHVRLVPLDSQAELPDTDREDFEQEYRRISRLLSSIPYEQAEVIRLRFYGDKSFREIAEILDQPLTTVKSRFQYGMEKIRQGMRAPSLIV